MTQSFVEQTNAPLTRKTLREFGFIFGGGIALIFGVIRPGLEMILHSTEPMGFLEQMPMWPWVFWGGLALLALILPMTLAPVYRVWMAFGNVMGAINSRIILGIVFYLVVFPTGKILRCFRDPMQRTLDPEAPTYRIPSEKLPPQRLEKPY